MQTPQTNQTIKQFTPKTNFLIFAKTGLLQYNTTNKGSRPEIQDDPGERGERKERRRSSTPPTRDSAACRSTNLHRETSRRETTSSKIRNHRCQEEERQQKPDEGIVIFDASHKKHWAKGWRAMDDPDDTQNRRS